MTDFATLEVSTPSDTEIVMTRSFAAPRQVVFDAWTRPELLMRWYNPLPWQLVECDIDLRVGGAWRFRSEGPDGASMVQGGVYRVLEPPERLVTTEWMNEEPEDQADTVVNTYVLTEDAGRTTLTITMACPSREVRDMIAATGMAEGVEGSYQRLDALVDTAALAARYRSVAADFTAIVGDAPADGWSNPSPCEGWAARDVVRHMVDMHSFLLGMIGRSLPTEAPSVDDDPAAAWAVARDVAQALLDDQTVALQLHEPHRHLGEGPWAPAFDMVITSDLRLHSWDLARSFNRDFRFDAKELAGWAEAFAEMPPEAIRQPEVFGPELTPPEGADEQTKLLAFLGRQAW